jgi:hypothetical protein
MDIPDIRRENLRQLFAKHGGPKALSERLSYRSPTFMTQMAGPNPSRHVSERTARSIERALALDPGSLDRPMPKTLSLPRPAQGVADQYLRVDAAAREAGATLAPAKFAEILEFAAGRDLSPEDLARLVRLAG